MTSGQEVNPQTRVFHREKDAARWVRRILRSAAATSLLSSLDPGNCRAPNGHRLERLRPEVYGLMSAPGASSLGEVNWIANESLGGSSNGRTQVSGSCYLGSNPSLPTKIHVRFNIGSVTW